MTKEEREASQKWWNSLSINEEKAYSKKYFPDVYFSTVCILPSFILEIYQKESKV